MALFEVNWSTDITAFNYHAVSAWSPEELATKLAAAVAQAVTDGESDIAEFNVSGTGAGPNWEAWFVTSDDVNVGGSADLTLAKFAAVVAGNPTEARLKLRDALAAASPAPAVLYKTEVAGGGIGTVFLACALYTIAPDLG